MKRQHIGSEICGCKISGYNYGPYPDHQYRYFNYVGLKNLLFPVQILAVGDDLWHRECLRERSGTDLFSMEYVVEGVFEFTQSGQTFVVHPGEIFLVQPDVNDSMRSLTLMAKKKAVLMTGPLLRSCLELIGLSKISFLVPSDLERIESLYQRIYDFGAEANFTNYRAACGCCYELLLELIAQSQKMEQPPELQNALEFIHSNLTEHLTLELLARRTGQSTATLNRCFQRYLHTSPIDYFLNQKLEHAASLLKSRVYSIKEVAALLNYSSPQYFATKFKAKFGISPSEV